MATAAQMNAILAAFEGLRNEMAAQFTNINKQLDQMDHKIVPREEHEARWSADAARLADLSARLTLAEQEMKAHDGRLQYLERGAAIMQSWRGVAIILLGPVLTILMFLYQVLRH